MNVGHSKIRATPLFRGPRISMWVNGGEPAGIAAARQSMQMALRGYSL
jgi:hypothetical protein